MRIEGIEETNLSNAGNLQLVLITHMSRVSNTEAVLTKPNNKCHKQIGREGEA
jgi:hypothetical protein